MGGRSEFPGQSSYSKHAVNDVVSLPASPGTIFIKMSGAADGDTATGQGAIVYDRPTGMATFTRVTTYGSTFVLHQTGSVPAGGSTRFRFAYVQDYHAANVASTAQTASAAFLNTITVSKPGNGSGTVTSSPAGVSCGSTCSHGYPYGTSVTLTATPATGSTFAGWSGGCTGSGTCKLTTNQNRGVTASFSLLPETLTVATKGDGAGRVTSTPAGISCGTTCSHAYNYGSSVTLTAKAAKGSSFVSWSGACASKATCKVTVHSALSVTASFGKDCRVPKLTGKSLKAARRLIKSHDCTLGKIKHAFSAGVVKGHVIFQKPKPGKRLKHGAKVRLVVSKG